MRHLKKFNEDYAPEVDNQEESNETWSEIISSPEQVKYYLDKGFDPNFHYMPLIYAIRGTWRSQNDTGEGYFESFKLLMERGIKLFDDVNNRDLAIKWAAEYGRLDFIEYMLDNGYSAEQVAKMRGFSGALSWLYHSRKMQDDKKGNVREYLEAKIAQYEPNSNTKYAPVPGVHTVGQRDISSRNRFR